MGDGAILRVFAFRPVGSESVLDSRLRDELMPGFAALPGILDTLAGRHGVGEGDERVIASIWESREAMEGAIGQAAPWRRSATPTLNDSRTGNSMC